MSVGGDRQTVLIQPAIDHRQVLPEQPVLITECKGSLECLFSLPEKPLPAIKFTQKSSGRHSSRGRAALLSRAAPAPPPIFGIDEGSRQIQVSDDTVRCEFDQAPELSRRLLRPFLRLSECDIAAARRLEVFQAFLLGDLQYRAEDFLDAPPASRRHADAPDAR